MESLVNCLLDLRVPVVGLLHELHYVGCLVPELRGGAGWDEIGSFEDRWQIQ